MVPVRLSRGSTGGIALLLWCVLACDADPPPGAQLGGPASHPNPVEASDERAGAQPGAARDERAGAQPGAARDGEPGQAAPQRLAAEPAPQPVAPADGPWVISQRGPDGIPRPFFGMSTPQDEVLDLLRRATPTSFLAVGSTSTVFKMTLDAPFAAAFKSATHKRPHGPASEVAAYRLSRCLGLNTVPPAISRRIPLPALRVAFLGQPGRTWTEVSERMLQDDAGSVPGVAIYWIPDMIDLGIDGRAGATRWGGWLRQNQPLPERSRTLAAHISTMLVFDYLIGNFDRFSGGNARGDVDGQVVFLRDHDVAFPGRLSKRVHRRVLERMLRAERFSRSFHGALLALDRACFVRELARDPAWEDGKLLHAKRIDGVFERLETAKSHIAALIQLHGEDAVLAFP